MRSIVTRTSRMVISGVFSEFIGRFLLLVRIILA
jgi:hypothetical protein